MTTDDKLDLILKNQKVISKALSILMWDLSQEMGRKVMSFSVYCDLQCSYCELWEIYNDN
jgi:hypothetical protein